jgi:ribonucrease Y
MTEINYIILVAMLISFGILSFFITQTIQKTKELADFKKQTLIDNEELKSKLKKEYSEKLIEKIEIKTEKIKLSLERDFEKQFQEKENIATKKLEKREQIFIEKEKQIIEQQKNIDLKTSNELTKIAHLTKSEARLEIKAQLEDEIGLDMQEWSNKITAKYKEEASLKASELVALAVQRCSSEVANEHTVTTIRLNSEDDKGKIIGKSGRNIQWLEKTLGVELVIDDSAGNILTVTGFSSLRRHIAKRTLERLLEDGRIHPASIEDMYQKAKEEISQTITEKGEWAMSELGIINFPPKLVRLIGRLHFRTSYGQNMLKHSVEMGKLARLLAMELNHIFPHRPPVDVEICIKGALLHDIGKAVDEDKLPKGNHIDLGEKICDMFDLDWRIKKCVSSHHDESYYDKEYGFCIESALVDACDNISGGRIGARKDSAEAYYQRMEALEKIANTTVGVTKSWIMRGSRELWVFFDTQKISPAKMHKTTREIANKIKAGVRYPGEIKIIGFWEDKAVEYAV